MKSCQLRDHIYIGSDGRASLFDIHIPRHYNGHLLVFAHGYMGFKDWGAWQIMENFFVDRGFGFCKFNFSRNGGTTENGIDFPDLDSFASNTYSIEKNDLACLLNKLEDLFGKLSPIHLIGHSRGGGIVILNAQHPKVKTVITLASISSIQRRFSDQEMLAKWKKDGIRYVTNQRTKQDLPHLYAQAEDALNNARDLDIERASRSISKPILLIHGDQDVSVPLTEGEELALWTGVPLNIIQNTDHVFGASHPYSDTSLPPKLKEACQLILKHLLENLN